MTMEEYEKKFLDLLMYVGFIKEEKVKLEKSSLKLDSYTKLATKFCGPFEILDRIGSVAYMFALFASMTVQNVFHASLLKMYMHYPNHVIDWNSIHVEPKGYFNFQSVYILDMNVEVL
jgi:hypothetical protein